MKKQFQMTDEELQQMIAIAQAPSIPVMKIGSVITGDEKQESANDFWKRLGKKYGFIWDSAEPCQCKGYTFFMATESAVTESPEERYEREQGEHEAYCAKIKPKRENYLTEQAFNTDMSEWEKKLSMDAPNKPGYYRANND